MQVMSGFGSLVLCLIIISPVFLFVAGIVFIVMSITHNSVVDLVIGVASIGIATAIGWLATH